MTYRYLPSPTVTCHYLPILTVAYSLLAVTYRYLSLLQALAAAEVAPSFGFLSLRAQASATLASHELEARRWVGLFPLP